jgi:hypothetical protein
MVLLRYTSIVPLEFKYLRLKTLHAKINRHRAVFALSGVITRSTPASALCRPQAGLGGTQWRASISPLLMQTATARALGNRQDMGKRIDADQ